MSESKAFRPDGDGMIIGCIQENADNQYWDEEKRWLAQTFLVRANQKPAGGVDAVNLRELQRGEVESAVIYTNMECTALYLNPPAILNGVAIMQVTRCAGMLDIELRITEEKKWVSTLPQLNRNSMS